MNAIEKLINDLNRLTASIETYNNHTHDELISEAFRNEGELSTIRSIQFGVENVYPLEDKIIIEFPDVEMISEFDGGNGDVHPDVFECELLRIIISGDQVNLCF